MEFKELIAGFAAKFGIEGLDGADGVAELDVEGIRVELLDDPQSRSIFACAEIGHPPPDANGAFGAMMLHTKFPEIPVSLERYTEVFRHPLL